MGNETPTPTSTGQRKEVPGWNPRPKHNLNTHEQSMPTLNLRLNTSDRKSCTPRDTLPHDMINNALEVLWDADAAQAAGGLWQQLEQ